MRKVAPAEGFDKTEAKLKSFAAGAGTILFFEDQDAVRSLQEKFALYADNFPVWSEQAGGMAQLSVWAALANAGVGASLQHYNPLVDADVAREWNIPASWKLRAQMPFGSNEAGFGEKAFMDDAERFAWPAEQAGHAPRWPGLKPAPVSTKTARVLFWARFLACGPRGPHGEPQGRRGQDDRLAR